MDSRFPGAEPNKKREKEGLRRLFLLPSELFSRGGGIVRRLTKSHSIFNALAIPTLAKN